MRSPIKVLFIEDNPADARLVKEELRSAGSKTLIQLQWVDRLEEGQQRIAANHLDAVLLDLSLPDSQGPDTLQRVLSRAPDTPVIVMTGQEDEETAIKALQAGAQDYLIKGQFDGRLLTRVIQYAIERKQTEKDLRESEERFRLIVQSAPSAMIVVDECCNITLANANAENLFGYSANELLGQPVELLVPKHFREVLAHLHQNDLAQPFPIAIGLRRKLHGLHKDGHEIPLEIGLAPHQSSEGLRVLALINDTTERKKAEAKIQTHLGRLSALRTIDLVITSSFDLRVTLEIILQQVIMQLGVDAAAIWLFNETSKQLVFSAGHGFRGSGINHLRLRLGEDYAGRVALERRLLYVPDLSRVEHRLTQAEPIDGEEFVSFYAVPLIAKEKVKGVLEIFHRSLLDPDLEWLDFFQTLAGQTAIAVDNAELFNNLQRSNSELILSYDATIEGWSRALDLRDKETEGHTLRVTELTVMLAREFGFTEDELMHIRRGALLHDIGKMGVPDHILLKPELLTEEEQICMQKHPQYAYDLLKPIAFLQRALDIPYCHHEKWDGTGYPRGLKGEEIPVAARLFAIVDIWDALTSDRPYRPAWSRREALTYIREQSGYHFDPLVVDLFFKVIK